MKGLSLQPPSVPRGRRTYHSKPLDEAEDEGLDHSVDSANAACEGLITPHPAASLVGRLFGLTRAEGRTPRFLWRETLEKPETASIITAPDPRLEGLARPSAQITSFCGTFSSKSRLHGHLAQLPAISAARRT